MPSFALLIIFFSPSNSSLLSHPSPSIPYLPLIGSGKLPFFLLTNSLQTFIILTSPELFIAIFSFLPAGHFYLVVSFLP